MARNKVTVIGAGNVGATTAQRIAEAGLADVVLSTSSKACPRARRSTWPRRRPSSATTCPVRGTNDYADTAGSDIIVVTSGLARQPGMSRDDLLAKNAGIVRSRRPGGGRVSPDAILIVVTNPLDAMCHVALEASGFPRERVIGMAGVLDSARFRTFIAEELGVSASATTHAFVLGGHGDTMVPLPRYSTVGGVPITELMSPERIEALSTARATAARRSWRCSRPAPRSTRRRRQRRRDGRFDPQRPQARSCPAPCCSRASTASTACSSACRSCSAAAASSEIIEIELTEAEQAAFDRSAGAVRELVDTLAALRLTPQTAPTETAGRP